MLRDDCGEDNLDAVVVEGFILPPESVLEHTPMKKHLARVT